MRVSYNPQSELRQSLEACPLLGASLSLPLPRRVTDSSHTDLPLPAPSSWLPRVPLLCSILSEGR